MLRKLYGAVLTASVEGQAGHHCFERAMLACLRLSESCEKQNGRF